MDQTQVSKINVSNSETQKCHLTFVGPYITAVSQWSFFFPGDTLLVRVM